MKGEGKDGRNTAMAQGRYRRSRTVREVGWEGQGKMWEVVWGAPANPLQVVVEGRTEPGSESGKGGAVLSDGRVGLLENATRWGGGNGLCYH